MSKAKQIATPETIEATKEAKNVKTFTTLTPEEIKGLSNEEAITRYNVLREAKQSAVARKRAKASKTGKAEVQAEINAMDVERTKLAAKVKPSSRKAKSSQWLMGKNGKYYGHVQYTSLK